MDSRDPQSNQCASSKSTRGSALDRISEFADSHIRLIRTVPYITGALGLLLLYRRTLWFKQFHAVSDVPLSLIATNTRLHGRVISCNWDSINVHHVPPAQRWRRSFPYGSTPERCLRIKFAGVAITNTKQSQQWLEERVAQRAVWFTPLAVNKEQRALECNVLSRQKGVFQRKYSVNEALLSAGLGVMVETERFRELNKQTQFITGLGKSEREAQRRGAGVWQGSPQVVWWRRGIQAVKKLLGKT